MTTPDSNSYIILDNNKVSYYRAGKGKLIIKNPINNQFFIRTSFGGNINVNYSDNKIVTENGANNTYYYPDRSEYITIGNETVTITTYPMTARPTTSPATVTMKSFNTSLPAGKVLVNFTASTTDGNNVNFTISTLVPNANYTVRRDGALYNISRANPSYHTTISLNRNNMGLICILNVNTSVI